MNFNKWFKKQYGQLPNQTKEIKLQQQVASQEDKLENLKYLLENERELSIAYDAALMAYQLKK